ncbi:MAG TPA: hypothetical protein VJ927_05715 [Actinomycetota bacterium]|nr:hypothetical protein [Actinomycetota bacterium]
MATSARTLLRPTADASGPRAVPFRRSSLTGSIVRWAQRGRLGSSRHTDLGRYTGSRV